MKIAVRGLAPDIHLDGELTPDCDIFVFFYDGWLYQSSYIQENGTIVAIKPSKIMTVNNLLAFMKKNDSDKTQSKQDDIVIDSEMEARFIRGTQHFKENKIDITAKSTHKFISWVTQDYTSSNDYDPNVKRELAKITARWWIKKCTQQT